MNNVDDSSTSLNLLDRVQSNDPDAWDALCRIYTPLIFGWARRAGLQDEDANDIVQDVFTSVSRGLEKFSYEDRLGSFRGWLWTITRNRIRDWFRKKSKSAASAAGGTDAFLHIQAIPDWISDDLALEQIESDHNVEMELLKRAAEIVKADVEPRTWQAFWRSTVEGHATSDIAQDLGMNENAVRQAKYRVLTRLRIAIGD